MNVRRGGIEEIAEIVRLWREMWDFHAPRDPRFQATPIANRVMEEWIEENLASDRSAVFVAEAEGGALEGYCLAMILENPPVLPHRFYGYVSEIAATRRRRGTGGMLLDAAHAWFRERGIPYVEVNVSARNEVGLAFWRKKGYGDFLQRLRLDF